LEEARSWLEKAFDLADTKAGSKEVKLRASRDPDLEPLWATNSEI